jgi:opacity protein-like surface antigen
MLRRRNWQFVCAALALVVASPASTEWFLDVYAGKGFMESADVDIRPVDVPPSLGRIQADLQDVELDDFTSYGLRIGRWFEAVPGFGLAVDLFRFAPDVSTQTVRGSATADLHGTIDDIPINIRAGVNGRVRLGNVDIPPTIAVSSLEVMLRRPLLTSSAFPNGRLQPYISAGPALLLTDIKPDVALGVKAGAGLVWRLSERIALFGEYRFTHFRPTIETGGVNVAGVETGDLEVELDANTQSVLGGLSFQFGE